MIDQPLDAIPILALYFLTVVAMMIVTEAGYRLSNAIVKRLPEMSDASVGTITGASLGLLAFLLAFVVSFGTTIFNERRQLVMAEANAIGTTYLRAGYLDEPYRTESRQLLREYTDQRLIALEPGMLEAAIARSEEIHNELWSRAEVIAVEKPQPTISLYIASLNEVIDRHAERIGIGIDMRIPTAVVLGLFIVALLTVFLVGLQSGYGERRNYLAIFVLILILSVVLLLIVDLDRSQEGLLRIPQQALMDLQRQLNAAP